MTTFGVPGWKQFQTARLEMLDAFDRARTKAKVKKVETLHGNVAEAELRKWLSSFLPKRYGVTSGYIVSPQVSDKPHKLPHFDVIIYDQMESPILWVEDSPDTSCLGRSLGIPVEHVLCVLEVKSQFTTPTVRDSVQHLAELEPLMQGGDLPTERYKIHLPPCFSCGLVFFEQTININLVRKAQSQLLSYPNLRGFFGGLILRGRHLGYSGQLRFLESMMPITNWAECCDSIQLSPNRHFTSMLTWTEPHFPQFAFDLLARLQGRYGQRMSSFHGFGFTTPE
jgi:hypothetical protein